MADFGQAEPLTALDEGMIHLHELYLAAKAAGFTETQAMTMVLTLMTNQHRESP